MEEFFVRDSEYMETLLIVVPTPISSRVQIILLRKGESEPDTANVASCV